MIEMMRAQFKILTWVACLPLSSKTLNERRTVEAHLLTTISRPRDTLLRSLGKRWISLRLTSSRGTRNWLSFRKPKLFKNKSSRNRSKRRKRKRKKRT
jgi:hypothetical protein